jgi:transmembrane sensor
LLYKKGKMENMEEYSFDESLIARFLTGEATDLEKLQLKEKMEENEAFRTTFFEMAEITDVADSENISEKIDVNNAIEKFFIRTEQKKVDNPKPGAKILLVHIARIAAVILLSIVIWKFFTTNKEIETTTANNILHGIILPDGTVVDLNKNSSFKYFKKFSASQRVVSLTGEAYFKVKKNSSSPFIINIGEVCIKVMGTSFNIMAYPDQKEVIVTVDNGRVKFYLKNAADKKITLIAGETGVFSSLNKSLTKYKNNDQNYVSWKTGIITFNETKLDDAIKILQKIYGVKISLQNISLGNCKVTATFENQPLDAILKMLELSFDIKTTKKDTIILTGEGCK